ncbi:methionyl-tRNA formyltransferase [Candidatus Puniceispirillum marinum]|uniref:Methionyl-tRNA formyltransferase n=1 Tax=Puniceispirillum marinum (strain IMCC1322) TaxID=488538 RepID=D5BTZ0_PUNMI|nr:methionyl-tRNA formyltransferase [Candidatus Puniceispirillum marinum]ADE39737.1 methionyl-tRNA formyltransferase [Candidatus Puniceispirillum marinum IMCC1322]
MGKLRIVYMGSPDFAIPALDLLAQNHEICAVYTQPPRRSGRGMQEQPVPLARHALDMGLPVSWPTTLNDKDVQDELAAYDADLFIVVAYGLLLPQAVLDIPRYGCLNGHASLLPRWRGAAPIQRAIEAGDSETGISIMLMEAGLDTGPVLATRAIAITDDMNAGDLHDALASLNATLLNDTVASLDDALLHRTPQASDGVTYAAKISGADAHIDWQTSAAELACHIRAYAPYPGAWCNGPKGRIRILEAQPAPLPHDTAGQPGSFAGQDDKGNMLMMTGDGILCVTLVQPAGKKPMPSRNFLNGVKLAIGDMLSGSHPT